MEELHEVMAVHTNAIGTPAVGGTEPIRPDVIFHITLATRPVTAAQSRTSAERTNSAPATMIGPSARRARTGHSVRTARSIRRDRKTHRVGIDL
jgi:hypothetical protein